LQGIRIGILYANQCKPHWWDDIRLPRAHQGLHGTRVNRFSHQNGKRGKVAATIRRYKKRILNSPTNKKNARRDYNPARSWL